ncbi:TIR domain-containing protein [Sphingobacterium sp. 2149]|uniref:TIR domain-containing protein n=1 Tax=Sphingobacterium sp. 2149 TaxID=2817763 RepID=UPI001AE61201|nr:TIR domain-containing protein [Sphingobacterium sp. 2149]MDR6735416.1 hypothetical protein [Sphingobacterium sp. 2149]
MAKKTRNIFISHYEKDGKHVQSLKNRLLKSGQEVRNFSVDSTKHKDGRRPSDRVIARLLNIRIKACSTFICLIGPDTHSRPWVNYEIRKAFQEGKRVIGIYTHGNKESVVLPEPMKKYSSSILGWNSLDKLIDVIEGKKSIFENQDGSNTEPYYKIERVCK